jgi:hypothetical protein
MTIFQKDVHQTTREYKITTVVVSLITYLVALVSIIAVNWAHIKRKIKRKIPLIKRKVILWWNSPPKDNPAKDSSGSGASAQSASQSGKAPVSKSEDKGKQPETSNEKVDEESGIIEGTGESSKPRSPWHLWQ